MARNLNLRRAAFSAACALAAGATSAAVQSSPPVVESYAYPLSPMQTGVNELQALEQTLEAARLGDGPRIRSAMMSLSDPLARKIGLWALIDVDATSLSYTELEAARRDLTGWPGADRRTAAVERTLEGAGLGPAGIIAWFAGADPQTAEGAMALAAAYQATGETAKAAETIRKTWTTLPFDASVQQQMLTRFGSMLTEADHAAREDMLLYGRQGDAARQLLPFLSPEQRALAEARIALREGSSDARTLVGELPASVRDAAGLRFEQALAQWRRGDTAGALAMIPSLDHGLPDEDSRTRMWKLRRDLVVEALKMGDSRAAYRAAANSGVDKGPDGAEAEFYAGWIALSRLKDPKLADQHFQKLVEIGGSPITESRALYWRGRAAEAMGDSVNAALFYSGAARWQTAFYGQLAAAKIGQTQLDIGHDPEITAEDRDEFNRESRIRAARMIYETGDREAFKSFVARTAEQVSSAKEAAMLVDLARNCGDQSLSMKVVRTAAQHGFILPDRGYPVRRSPGGAVETAFVMGIVRQESGFDPTVRSPAGALGMMQLMPSTASIVARKLGYDYGSGRLEDADYNMQLGSAYLGQLVDKFDGSYLLAAAAYNAGPGRPTQWTSICGDPRASSTDPTDFIECIPFTETRNYVMRVLEATEVYRARLGGGDAKVSLAADLKRGGYGYAGPSTTVAAASMGMADR